ncbi:hypothetical protein SRHO_G00248250 [Serrasalmus rhombeus]
MRQRPKYQLSPFEILFGRPPNTGTKPLGNPVLKEAQTVEMLSEPRHRVLLQRPSPSSPTQHQSLRWRDQGLFSSHSPDFWNRSGDESQTRRRRHSLQ